jgi:hypothetical protein
MSETIGEMILPGTYIEVRSEGLIGVGGIATGNVGVVGTASRGPIGTAQLLGDYTEALDVFGAYDDWPAKKADQPKALTLTRTLEQLFAGGASTVYAVRIAAAGASPMASMSWKINSASDVTLFTVTANSPGTWGNSIKVAFDLSADVPTLQLTYSRRKETFVGADAGTLAQAITDGSKWVTVDGPKDTDKATVPAKVVASATAGGPDGTPATLTEVKSGLAALAQQPVNIVVVGGLDAKTVGGAVQTHLDATENEGNERIAVLGAWDDDPANISGDDVPSNPRIVLVAPGLLNLDTNATLPPSYAAAVVAGKLASLAPHVSLTNQEVPVDALSRVYTRAEQKNLLEKQLLVLQKHLGFRALKGITTDTGAFRQISVRRIVDYAKAGVRIGANPYIGRLNNVRVRAALKATLDGFLSSMVFDEMLTAYTLDVSATRAQEIAGQAIVTMTIQPTFSIDYVKVVMNLQ